MKILVATRETQGWRPNDFSATIDGELVLYVPSVCSGEEVDGKCGCYRSMAGITSHRATTTVKVAEKPELNPKEYATLIKEGLEQQGYLDDEVLEAEPDARSWLRALVEELLTIADAFDTGTVLEPRGRVVRARLQPDE